MITDITSTNITIPPDGDTYFAPISPAASSVKEELNKGPSLLEMLQRGNQPQGFPGRKITKKPSLRDLGLYLSLNKASCQSANIFEVNLNIPTYFNPNTQVLRIMVRYDFYIFTTRVSQFLAQLSN